MTVETMPTTNPLTVPEPKPSEIVRSWPFKNWCKGATRETLSDGTIRLCALGILAETGGHEWHDPRQTVGNTVSRVYGLTHSEIVGVQRKNDWYGKDAAADYLQSIGR